MFLVCRKCNSQDIEICPNDNEPFYCNSCNNFLKFKEVKKLKVISNHYYKSNITQLVVFNEI